MSAARFFRAAVAAVMLVAAPAAADPSAGELAPNQDPVGTRAIFRVKGMDCHGCAERIEKGLRKVVGVLKVTVEFGKSRATVTYDPRRTDPDKIKAAIDKMGFEATLRPMCALAEVGRFL